MIENASSEPVTGNFRPNNALSAFNGISAANTNGTWSLLVQDLDSLVTGTLRAFTIHITTIDPQAITNFVASPASPVFTANGTFTVSATGGASGNPVVFSSASTSVCTVAPSTNTVTMLTAGQCQLRANQAGDGVDYSDAPEASLAVTLAPQATAATATPVPTLSQWALGLLALLMGAGVARRGRQRVG